MVTSWIMLLKIVLLIFLLLFAIPLSVQVWQEKQDWEGPFTYLDYSFSLVYYSVVHMLVAVTLVRNTVSHYCFYNGLYSYIS